MVLKIFGRTNSFAGDYGEAELKVAKTKQNASFPCKMLAPSFIKQQSLIFSLQISESEVLEAAAQYDFQARSSREVSLWFFYPCEQ